MTKERNEVVWKDGDWELVEITDPAELRNDANDMDYEIGRTYRCTEKLRKGLAHFFSIKNGGETIVTMQVDKDAKEVIRLAGRYNRTPAKWVKFGNYRTPKESEFYSDNTYEKVFESISEQLGWTFNYE